MDFFKEFSRQFSGKGRAASEKAKEGAELNRLSAGLSEAEAALNALFARYGRACYAIRAGRGNPNAAQAGRGHPDDARALALRIQATELQVEELTDARDAARELKRCLNCGAVFGREARFCAMCGKRLPEEAPKPEPVSPGEYCPECGAKRENGDSRCPVCGRDFDALPETTPVRDELIHDDMPAPEEPDGSLE